MKKSVQQFIAFAVFVVVMFGLAYGVNDLMRKVELKAAEHRASIEASGAAAYKAGATAGANPYFMVQDREDWLNGWIKAGASNNASK